MRFFLLSNSYLPVLGGLQTATHNLALQLIEFGHLVQVVTQRYPRYLPDHEYIHGVPIWRRTFLTPQFTQLKRGRPDLFLAGLYYRIATKYWLAHRIRTFKPAVVNLHFPDSQIPFIRSLRSHFSFRLVVSLHGHEVLKWFDDDGNFVLSSSNTPKFVELISLLNEADAVTACSQYLLGKVIELAPSIRQKAHVIYNGVEVTRFTEKKAYLHIRAYCLAYGRLTLKKGFDLLVRAFAIIAKKYPQLDLIMAGEGEERQALESLINELGLTGRVIFLGRAMPEQVVELLNGCQFVVIPSRVEPFGIVALEAMASGKPILATNVGGLPELLDCAHVNATLVSPTVKGLINGLGETLENITLAHHSLKKQVELADFSWKKAGSRYEEIFNHAMSTKS